MSELDHKIQKHERRSVQEATAAQKLMERAKAGYTTSGRYLVILDPNKKRGLHTILDAESIVSIEWNLDDNNAKQLQVCMRGDSAPLSYSEEDFAILVWNAFVEYIGANE